MSQARIERRMMRKHRRMMAAELVGTMLDCPRTADLPPELRAQLEQMVHSPRALDELVGYFMSVPQSAVPPPPPVGMPSSEIEFAHGLFGEWGARLEERARGGQ